MTDEGTRWPTFESIPTAGALSLCWKRLTLATEKWEERGAAVLSDRDILDIEILTPLEGKRARQERRAALERAAVRPAPPTPTKVRGYGHFHHPKNVDDYFGFALLLHEKNRDVLIRAGDLAKLVGPMFETIEKVIETLAERQRKRNKRLEALERRLGIQGDDDPRDTDTDAGQAGRRSISRHADPKQIAEAVRVRLNRSSYHTKVLVSS